MSPKEKTRQRIGNGVRTLLGAAQALREGRVEDAEYLRRSSPLKGEDWFWVGVLTTRDLSKLLASAHEDDTTPEDVLAALCLDTAKQHADRAVPPEADDDDRL